MVKNALKKSVSLFFCFAIVASFLMVSPAKAEENPFMIAINSDMSREDCWIIAGNHPVPGLSRARVAVELFASSQKKFHKDHLYMLFLEWGCLQSCSHHATPLGGIACGVCLAKFNDLLGNGISEDTIKLGGDSDTQVNHYYKLWNAEEGSTICSALDSNKVVDISDNSNANANGTKVQLWSSNGTSAQRFYILHTGEGNWCNIFKAGTFKCLDVASGKAEKGTKVQLWNYNGTAAQDWELVNAGGDFFYLKSRVGDGCYRLDVSGGSIADGTQIQIWASNTTKAQKWKLA